MKILLKNGTYVNTSNNTCDYSDILIEDGIVAEIGNRLSTAADDIIDVNGRYIMPGLVDAHCHLRDPGYEYKEDIETGTMSAAAGGFTSVACMPNTNPPADNMAVINYIRNKAQGEGYVNVYPIGAITRGLKGEELADIGELKFAGAVAVSDDGYCVRKASVMKKAMYYASMFDLPVISHCEDTELSEGGVMNEGYYSTILGLRGIPSPAESIIVSRDIQLAEYTGCRIHIAHVSTAQSVSIIREAKKRGVQVTAETCPHYFVLTDKACEGYNTYAKVNPPLQTQKDVDAVIEGLKDGTIDIISTDHAPHHKDEKNTEFDLAAKGFSGFETALSLGVTFLVSTGHLTINSLISKMTVKPASMLGINKGVLETGKAADITIFDPDESYVVESERFLSKGKNSPFNGMKLKGKVTHTLVNGKFVIRDSELY